MNSLDYIILALYLIATVWLGSSFFKGQTSLREYFLGSKNVPWWAAAFSGVATMISGASYLGGPGQAFRSDFTFLEYRLALPIALVVICFVILPFFYRLDVFSAYEYLERRFDLKTRCLISFLYLALKCLYLGIVIYAPSLVLAQMTGLPLHAVILSTGLFTTVYSVLGGMRGVIWTDTMQLVVLLGGLAVSIYVLITRIGGGLPRIMEIASANGKLRFFDFSLSSAHEVTFWSGLIGGAFFMVSQYGVDQAELQRFLTTSSLRKTRLAVVSSLLAGTAVGFVLFFIGTLLYVFYLQHPSASALGMNPDRVFPKFIIEELPHGITGFVIAGVLAASMSAISGVLNSLTTVAVSDFYNRFARAAATIASARYITAGFGVLCTILALFVDRFGNILVSTAKITNLFGGTLVGIFLLGMLWRRANGMGAFLGALTGLAGALSVWLLTPISMMWYGAVSAVVAFSSGAFASLFFPSPAPDKLLGLTLGGNSSRRKHASPVDS